MTDTADIMVEQTTEIANGDAFIAGLSEELVEVEETADASTAAAEQPVEADTTAKADDTAPVAETIAYRYNHSVTELPLAAVSEIATALGTDANALVATLQKGSNYDALAGRTKPYETVLNRLGKYAEEQGIGHEDAASRLLEALNYAHAAKYAKQLKQQYPNAPQQLVNQLALRQAGEAVAVAEAQQREAAEKERESRERDMWVSFFNRHKDEGITTDNLSPRLLEAARNGEDPELVYMAEQNAKLKQQLKEEEQKRSNAVRSMGSAKTTASATAMDNFLLGFNS